MSQLFRRTAVAFLLFAGSASAQSVSGSISGTVVDPSHQVVPGVTVTLIDEDTGALRTVPTNETGSFVFSALQPARYTVRIEMVGFSRVEKKNVTLPANERLSIGTVTLAIGGVSETVTTTAEGSFVQTNSSDRSALLTDKQLEMVAVRGRDVVSLLRVLPGVSYQGESEAPGGSFGTTTPNISGNRNSWNTVTVDGLVGNDLGSPQIFSGTINFDAISEVKVQLNNYQAENGRNGGAMISVVTKSGTKDYTGQRLRLQAQRKAERERLLQQPQRHRQAALPLHHARRHARRAGAGRVARQAVLLLLLRELGHGRAAAGAPGHGPDRARAPGGLLAELYPGRRADRDPRSRTGQNFPDNRIPADRINASGMALLNVFPLPQRARSQRHGRQLQLPVPGEPGRAAAPAPRAGRHASDRRRTRSTSAPRTGTATTRATQCRPAPRTGACSASTTPSRT